MNDQFVFPVNFEDVQLETYNRYNTINIVIKNNEREIWENLDRIKDSVVNDFEEIIKDRNFDYYYHLIKLFSENIESRPMGVLQKLGRSLKEMVEKILKVKLDSLSEEGIRSFRVCYKMEIFLTLFYISSVTKCKTKQTQADIINDAINKNQKKKKTNDIELTDSVLEYMKKLIILLKDSLGLDYARVWERKEIDPELFKRYTQVCVKILESSIAKDGQVITDIFKILEIIIKVREELFQDIQRVLVNLIYESQGSTTDILVSFFSRAETPELQKLCTNSIINVVKLLLQKNLHSQASSIKNTKQFLSKLSQKIPKIFYNFLSFFICLYLHESYLLRNAISDILKNILKYVVNNEAEDSLSKVRDKFINTLIQRIYDKNSYCRAHVLGILIELTVEKAIPKKYTIMFLKAGVDRIKDQSVNTRKRALQLISTIMEDVWPEGQSLRSLSVLKDQLQVLNMSKQSAEKQVEELKQRANVEDESDDEVERIGRELNICSKKLNEYERKQVQLQEEMEVVTLIQDVLDKVKILLSSRTQTDVIETIKLFIKFNARKIEYCKEFMPNIRLLIFSKQKKIKDEVLMTFTQLHLMNKTNEQVADELIGLFKDSSPQDLSALQEILQIIISESIAKNIPVIKLSVFALLWHKFIQYERSDEDKVADKRAILTILRITFNKDPQMIKQQNVVSFLAILKNYINTKRQDFYILRQILKIIMIEPKTCPVIDSNARNLLLSIICILVNSQDCFDQEWYSVSEHLLTCIYKISQNPQKLNQVLIKKLHQNLVQKNSSSVAVAHFIFTLSHGCLKMLIHLDSLQNKIKALNNDNGKDKKKSINEEEEQEEELDKVVGGIQAEIERKVAEIQNIGQRIIEDPFISRWVKVVETISNDLSLGNELQIIAVLSYCKFMCISRSYCQQNIKKLMDILRRDEIDSVIKNNIIIAIGDLLHRFPNTVESQGEQLYPRLHDKDIRVRKTTLTVLTHLALNDMIKIKGQYICYIAKMFQDEDPEIQSLVKQFFSEVNRKDPKYLFNIIPEALTKFSEFDNFGSYANEKTFTVFMENVLPLMEKDKYSESLIVKLCQRLSTSLNMLEIKNTAYCLSEINMNEKGLRKLIESFPDFKKTLETPEVLLAFKNLVTKLKKSSKNDIKAIVQELDQKISNAGEETFNAAEIRMKNERMHKKKDTKKKEKGQGSASTQGKKGKAKKYDSQSEQNDMDNEPDSQSSSKRPAARQRPMRNRKKPIIIEESDEDY